MIKLDVLNLLEKQGKTKYWLYKQLGMSYQNFNKMINNQTNLFVMKILKRCVCCCNAHPMNCLKSPRNKKPPKDLKTFR